MASISPPIYYYADFTDENSNLSLKNREEMCNLAYSYRQQYSIIAICFVQTILSLLTLVFLYLLIKCKEMRRVFSIIDLDLKIIILVGFMLYTIGSLNAFTFYGYKFSILTFIHMEPCWYIWKGSVCYWNQAFFGSICVIGYILFAFSMFIERFIVTFNLSRCCCKGIIGLLLACFIVGLSPVPSLTLIVESLYVNDRVYCSTVITYLDPTITSSAYFTTTFDLAISFFDFLLFRYNKYRIARRKKIRGFNLQKSFNLKAIKIGIEVIYPFSIMNGITFGAQSSLYVVYVNYAPTLRLDQADLLFEIVNFGRVSANFILIGFLLVHSKYRKRKNATVFIETRYNATDVYFDDFKRLIS